MISRRRLILIIIPFLFLLSGLVFYSFMVPISLGSAGYDEDPSYVYLFNGLFILNGHSPLHIDHPGTPLQILSALIIFAKWTAFGVYDDISLDVMHSPESYIQLISYILLTLNFLALYYLGSRVYQNTKSYSLALISQITPFIFANYLIARSLYLAPESLLIFSSSVLLGLTCPLFLKNNEMQHKKDINYFKKIGIILGFGLAVKLTFLPMIFITFLIKAKKNIIIVFKSLIFSFFIFIFPIIHKFINYLLWIKSIATHTERNGSGSFGFFDTHLLVENFQKLSNNFSFFYIINIFLVLFITYLLLKNDRAKNSRQILVSLVFLSINFCATLLIVKNYADHYLLPVVLSANLIIVFLLNFFRIKKIIGSKTLVFATASLFFFGIYNTYLAYNFLELEKSKSLYEEKSLNNIMNSKDDVFLISSYRSRTLTSAIYFGLSYANSRRILFQKAEPLFESSDVYDIFSGSFAFHSRDEISEYVSSKKNIYFIKLNVLPEPEGFCLEKVFIGPTRTIYIVKSVKGCI